MDDIKFLLEKVNNYYDILKEGEKTLEDFYRENRIDPDKLDFAGSGAFGEAYYTGDGRVLKKTTSRSEFKIASEIANKNIPVLDGFAKIYKAEIVQDRMYIIMEELDVDEKIEDLFYELQSLLSAEGFRIQYLGHLDLDELDISDELKDFIDDIDDINRGYRYLGIEASDIRPENLGYDKNGKVKAFDLDDLLR